MIPYGKHCLDEDDINAVTKVLREGNLTQGPLVERFEMAVADYVGAKYAVAVSSGTTALHLATIVADVKPDNSVITSPITFVASANAALYVGAQPVFTDIEASTVNMSADLLQDTLIKNPNARAVIPVHFAGLPCDMQKIETVTENNNVILIEDAAHALGAKYPDGKRVGCCSHSTMTIFSFHPVKAIAAGEGGMITTNDESIYRRLLRLRSHGINKLNDEFQFPENAKQDGVNNPWYYEMQELGFNYRITDIQCALALSQLKKLDIFIERRRVLVKKYDAAFSEVDDCEPAQLTGRDISGHHLYVLRINFENLKLNRAEFMLKLKEQDIGSQVHYIPVTTQPYYRKLGVVPENYENAQHFYEQALSIPLYYELTDEQQQYVISKIIMLLK